MRPARDGSNAMSQPSAYNRFWNALDSPGLRTMGELLLWIKCRGGAPLLYAKRQGAWQCTSARDFYQGVRRLGAALRACGLAAGDRVGLFSENRPEWMLVDFACLSSDLIDVPIYPTLPADQVAYILRDSGARGVFVSTAEQVEKVIAVWDELPELEWICAFDAAPAADDSRQRAWATLTATVPHLGEADFDAALLATPSDRVVTLLYTSGTTGVPKGVMLTHGNLVSNLNVAPVGFDFRDDERRLSFLPLSHITERHLGYVDFIFEQVTYYAESFDKVPANLLEVKPTFIVAVPRVYEKIVARIKAEVAGKPAWLRGIFNWARGVGRQMSPYWENPAGPRAAWALRLKSAVADRLVFSRLRKQLGGHVNKCLAGGAPLGRELAEFMLSLGLVIDQGYGLTETSPVIAVNKPGQRRVGSVGKPLPNLEVRFEPDGELCVRGPSVFSGYYHLPEETAAALQDGWFYTGDIGHLDADGFLYITDRKKDLLKTSGGKFIAPQPIEARLKDSAYVAEAVVIGDRRNYASVLIVPNFPALATYARQHGRTWSSNAELCNLPIVQDLFTAELARLNAGLARFETLKKFRLVPQEFSLAGGEITPTVKVRRRTIETKYRALIESMYAEEQQAADHGR